MNTLHVEGFIDPASSTVSYLVMDTATLHCALIDTVLDYDPAAGRTATMQADRMIARVRSLGATVDWILETHAHADHLSAAPYLNTVLGGKIAIGRQIRQVQHTFGALFHAGADFAVDGSQFDHLFEHGEIFRIGQAQVRVLHTPGHTPACLTYVVRDRAGLAAFVGDTLFMPDYGTARCDFPGGDARTLYRSIQSVLSLPPQTRLYMCHDYRPHGREFRYVCTVAEQRAGNIHVREGIGEDAFVARRTARDAGLGLPALMLTAIQVNMRAGRLPPAEQNGIRYLKIPLNAT